MNRQELKIVLDLHRKWVLGEDGGQKANLRSANLSDADLRSANLISANLSSANLSSANLSSANLSSANLRSANLRSANLSDADLISANLSFANLSSANLSSANLSSANLRYADLNDADLSFANLSDADLRSANLRYADLSLIKDDFFKRLTLAKKEAVGLYDFIVRGYIDGSSYEGECACFCGSVAIIAGENYKDLTSGLKPDSDSPTERWFLAIRMGDTPHNNVVSKITSEWLKEFMKSEGLIIPKYKLISSLERPELFEATK